MKHNIRLVLLVAVNLVMLPLHVFFFLFAGFMALVPIYPTRIGNKNIRDRLGFRGVKIYTTLVGVYLNYLYYLYEIYFLHLLGLEIFEGIEEFDAFYEDLVRKYTLIDRSVLILGAHFSNFELLGYNIAKRLRRTHAVKIYALTKPSRIKIVTRFWEWLRPALGFEVLQTNRPDLKEAMHAVAKRGQCLTFIADQKPRKNAAFIEFFGEPCAFPMSGLDVPKTEKMPIVCLGSVRIFPGYAKFYFSEAYNAHMQNEASDRVAGNLKYQFAPFLEAGMTGDQLVSCKIMSSFAGWLELLIRLAPSQWFWDYNKWSRKRSFDKQE